MEFENILQRMLDRVPNTFDKREGSMIYDALAPAARELANMYYAIDEHLRNTFAGTADREWLIKRCAEIGITPNPATYAVRKGVFTPATLEIQLGERFNLDDLNYVVIEKLDTAGEYALQCETEGEMGNFGVGALVPIQYIRGLESAELTGEILIYGEDEEETEALRQRYFETLPTMTLDGNVAQYSKWCREYEGIGNFKIFPEWNGKNTVKVSILSSENTKASQTLIDNFQTYLDPANAPINDTLTDPEYPQERGLGMGKAPIGAIVTVSTATEKVINVSAQVMLREGYTSVVGLEAELADYLNRLNYSRTTVSYVAISAVIQNNASIDVVLNVTVNGAKNNIELGEEEITKLGTVNVEVEA